MTPVWLTLGHVGTVHPATGLVLGLAWAVAVATIADGTLGRRTRRLPGDQPARETTRPTTAGRAAAVVRPAVTRLGATIRRGLAPVTGHPRWGVDPRLHPDHDADHVSDHDRAQREEGAADRRIGWAALASSLLLLVAPALAAAPVTWAVAAPVLAARRGHARHDAALADQLPDVVDLLALTAAAGLPVAAALVAVGRRPGGPLGVGLGRAGAHVRHGGSTAEALAQLAATGAAVRPLVDALVQHDRYGTPLLPALERVGIEARANRRRRSEEAARRLPVTLLFPLVLTTFPAFVLLTVVPLLAGSLGSLSPTPT
ncbi:MAG: type II secretion system F family protein [Acidimicrobiales bacterium]|nr:type II secretion system F family protein [Acidimicrobiales bacterium]